MPLLRMWIKRLLLQWLTIFVVCFIMGILIKIHMSPSFLVKRNETVIKTEVTCRRKMEVKSIPFIWEDNSHTWYNVTESNKSSDSETLDLADIQNLGSITMSSELVAILEKNKRESYRILGKFLKNNGRNNLKLRKVLEGHSKWEGRIATFTSVVISSDGWIVHNKHCHAVINGGCKTPDSWRQPKNPIQNYDRVISIAMYWGDGI